MKYLKIPIEFEIGKLVFLKTDSDQSAYTVLGYKINPKDSILYQIQNADYDSTYHYRI